jgi:ABC-2 type transport system ATP-binding protein
VMHKGKLLAQATPAALMQQTDTASLLEAFFYLSGESSVGASPAGESLARQAPTAL